MTVQYVNEAGGTALVGPYVDPQRARTIAHLDAPARGVLRLAAEGLPHDGIRYAPGSVIVPQSAHAWFATWLADRVAKGIAPTTVAVEETAAERIDLKAIAAAHPSIEFVVYCPDRSAADPIFRALARDIADFERARPA